MLIGSLKNLGRAFGVETQKGIFPYNFVNENNSSIIGWTFTILTNYFNKNII